MAKGFERQAVIGTVPFASEGDATRALADTIQSFTNWSLKKHTQQRVISGEEEARQVQPGIESPELKTKTTAHGQAYNRIVQQGHMAAVKNDYSNNFSQLYNEVSARNGDPQEFYDSAKAYKNKTLNDVSPEQRQAFELDMDASINHYGNNLTNSALKRATQENILAITTAGENFANDAARAAYDGDTHAMGNSRVLFYLNTVDSLREMGRNQEADAIAKQFEEKLDKQLTLGQANNAIQAGRGDLYISKFIENPPKDLTVEQVDAYTASMMAMNNRERSLNRAQQEKMDAAQASQIRNFKYQTKITIEAIGKGMPVSEEQAKTLSDNLLALSQVDPKTNVYKELTQSLNEAMLSSKVVKLPVLAQDEELKQIKAKAKTPEDFIAIDKAQRASEQFINDFKKDSLQAVANQGGIELAPIDMQNFPAWLQGRGVSKDFVESKHGGQSGYLTDNEIPVFSEFLSGQDTAGKIALTAQINQALGEKASDFYEQLKLKKSGGTFAMAGQVAGAGDTGVASMIIRGAERRKVVPIEYEKDLKRAIDAELSEVYAGNPTQLSMVKQASLDVYSQMTEDNGGNKLNIEDAIFAVTGGTIEFNDRMILPPERGMTENQFEGYIDSLKPYSIPKLDNYTQSQVIKGLKNEDLILHSYKDGQYLISEEGGRFLYQNGEPFVFNYNEINLRRDNKAIEEKPPSKLVEPIDQGLVY